MFIEERLLDFIAYGFTGSPTFNTTMTELYSGVVARNAERTAPLFRGEASYESVNDEHRGQVVDTYIACLGPVYSFRFKNWLDYTLINQVIGTSVGGVDETMQLVKAYAFGQAETLKTIKKPVADTVILLQDGAPLASTVDTTTGIVTFTASTPGKVITAHGEFDVPVMFGEDSLGFSLVNWKANSASLVLREDLTA